MTGCKMWLNGEDKMRPRVLGWRDRRSRGGCGLPSRSVLLLLLDLEEQVGGLKFSRPRYLVLLVVHMIRCSIASWALAS